MKVFCELKGEILSDAIGKEFNLKLQFGLCSILQIASISGSPFQKSAWISGEIYFFSFLYFFLLSKIWIGNPLCHKFLWIVTDKGSNAIEFTL